MSRDNNPSSTYASRNGSEHMLQFQRNSRTQSILQSETTVLWRELGAASKQATHPKNRCLCLSSYQTPRTCVKREQGYYWLHVHACSNYRGRNASVYCAECTLYFNWCQREVLCKLWNGCPTVISDLSLKSFSRASSSKKYLLQRFILYMCLSTICLISVKGNHGICYLRISLNIVKT